MLEGALEIQVAPIPDHSDQYMITYRTSSYPITFDPAKSFTFTDLLRRLQSILMGRPDPSNQLAPLELLWEVGTRLWQALLPDTAPPSAREDLAKDLRTGLSPLLLSLPERLIELPWELLCDPQLRGEEGFVARKRPLLRLVLKNTQVAPLQFPLRVLLLISSPPSLGEDSRVDVESERAAVEEAVREACEAGLLHLMVEDIVTVQRVREALMRFKPHILHYIGHGGYNEKTGGVLLWEDERGNAVPMTDRHLADLLRPRHLAAVVLHACKTGRRNARSEIRGVAGTLIHEGIPAVVSQQANLSYQSSQRASKAWYTALTSGATFAEAIFEVRQELSLAERPDWAVPVLQASPASLHSLLDAQAVPGSPDPRLTPEGVAADLPAPAGVFVGRQRELRALRRLLEPASQQVMALVTGPGGIGKSTLVAQAITRYGRKYKAALTLSCLGYQDISLFLQRMAEFLKRQGVPGLLENTLADPQLSMAAKIESTIVAFNQAGPFLLVVDNLETAQNDDHTLRDDNLLYFLQKLLTNLRRGHVLITGRYAVKDLLPQGKFATSLLRLDLDDLSVYETDQLLTRHASLAHLGEKVRESLIQEFGGLPYVYDLLSSDADSQSLELLIRDVQGRITEERKKRSAAEWQEVRRQVVEFAALESTVARLPESARTLLARISVFRQAFPLVALEQGLHAIRAEWQPLLDWSLLRYDPLEKAYHLHSLTRRHAENLLAAHDRQHTQEQLATWYESYADHDSHDLTDYLEAHYLFRAAGNLQRAGDLVSQLATVLRRFGLYAILKELFTLTLNDFRNVEHDRTAAALHQLGMLAQAQGDNPEARRLYQESLAIQEQLGNLSGRASSLHALGVLAQGQGDYPEARRLYQESLAIEEQLGDLSGRASSLHQLGMLAQDQGDYHEARRLYQESLAIQEQLGNLSGIASSLGQLGMLVYEQGEREEALIYTIRAYLLFERLHDPYQQLAQRMLATIRSQLDEAVFTQHWQKLAGDHPLPSLPLEREDETHQQEESENDDDDQPLTLADLPHLAATVKQQGTQEQCQQFAGQLAELQQQLPAEEAPLGQFLRCLIRALHDETPDTSSLETPFTELWQAFQHALTTQTDEESE